MWLCYRISSKHMLTWNLLSMSKQHLHSYLPTDTFIGLPNFLIECQVHWNTHCLLNTSYALRKTYCFREPKATRHSPWPHRLPRHSAQTGVVIWQDPSSILAAKCINAEIPTCRSPLQSAAKIKVFNVALRSVPENIKTQPRSSSIQELCPSMGR